MSTSQPLGLDEAAAPSSPHRAISPNILRWYGLVFLVGLALGSGMTVLLFQSQQDRRTRAERVPAATAPLIDITTPEGIIAELARLFTGEGQGMVCAADNNGVTCSLITHPMAGNIYLVKEERWRSLSLFDLHFDPRQLNQALGVDLSLKSMDAPGQPPVVRGPLQGLHLDYRNSKRGPVLVFGQQQTSGEVARNYLQTCVTAMEAKRTEGRSGKFDFLPPLATCSDRVLGLESTTPAGVISSQIIISPDQLAYTVSIELNTGEKYAYDGKSIVQH